MRRLLIRGEDERGPLGNDFREDCGTLPTAAELPDAVDAAKLGDCGKASRD